MCLNVCIWTVDRVCVSYCLQLDCVQSGCVCLTVCSWIVDRIYVCLTVCIWIVERFCVSYCLQLDCGRDVCAVCVCVCVSYSLQYDCGQVVYVFLCSFSCFFGQGVCVCICVYVSLYCLQLNCGLGLCVIIHVIYIGQAFCVVTRLYTAHSRSHVFILDRQDG